MGGVKLLQQAKVMVPKTGSFGPVADSLPDRAVLSYIHRGLAVGHIVNRGWSEAKRLLEVSRSNLPTNTASAYLMGYCEQACGDWKKGADFGLESISLDPDFKQPYLLVSNCFLRTSTLGKLFTTLPCRTETPTRTFARRRSRPSAWHGMYTAVCGLSATTLSSNIFWRRTRKRVAP